MATRGDNGDASLLRWSDDGRNAVVMVRAIDNKDRWIAGVDLASATLHARHRLTAPGWINWGFNEFGWLPDNQTLWFLSEQSGYSHLYTQRGSEKPRQRTSGNWEVSSPVPTADGSGFLFVCNRASPGKYEVCRNDLATDAVRELTDLGGVEQFTLSPDGTQILVNHSSSYLPMQLALGPGTGGTPKRLTDTRSPAFKARAWIQPEIVHVPSRHGAGTVWGKYLSLIHI